MFGVFVLAAAAAAQPEPNCAGTQEELNECAQRDFKQADRALNVQWQKLVVAARRKDRTLVHDRHDPPAFEHLLKGQRAWLTYRDETCAWVQTAFGGSIAPMNSWVCMTDMTNARTKELERLARDPNDPDQPI